MAFGEHWEWRGFGRPGEGLLAAIDALPLKFPAPQSITDHYLWIPGSRANVKLRAGDLKFKRLLERRGEFERWVEDEAENHPFPLPLAVFRELVDTLDLSPAGSLEESAARAGTLDRDAFVRILQGAQPPVRLVSVAKVRVQHDLDVRGAPGAREPVTVEVARISAPERLVSVGLEHPRLEDVRAARDDFDGLSVLRCLSYLDAVSIWGAGRMLAAQ